MAEWGVSVFLGSPDTADTLPGYLAAVAERGGTAVFTSLHIPEVPLQAAAAHLEHLTRMAAGFGMQTVADIAPKALAGLGATLDDLGVVGRMGLAGIRLDYGFTPAEVARVATNPLGIRIVLNASTVDPDYLRAVMAAGADPQLLEGCHNYYPRPETGISLDSFQRSSQVFRRFGLRVAAFVPGAGGRRGPLFAGLPTVERHRQMEAGRAAAELLATGLTDTVLFGDPWATAPELDRVSAVARAEGVVIRVRLTPGLSALEQQIALGFVQENRTDAAEFVIRSTASRAYAAQGPAIAPFNTATRPAGAVTVDNLGYLRYSGELQIATVDLPADPRVNVVGQVIPEDLPLLRWVGGSRKFQLVAVA
ncbi:MAG TPA: MupG family TIM beta-alpha barrel fold protein [Symbiobacteriaceae bacterium]|jgi:hypothetical protein